MSNLIQIRRDTAAGWELHNPVLAVGEEGYETDTRRRKVGDGYLPWHDLRYDTAAAAAGGGGSSLLALIPELADVTSAINPPGDLTLAPFTSTAPTGTTVPILSAPVSVSGAVLDGTGTNVVNDPHAVHPSVTVEFDVTAAAAAGAQVALVVTNPAAVQVDARISSNGKTVGQIGAFALAAGATAYLPITVPGGTTQCIRVELQNAYLTGIRYVPGKVALNPAADRSYRVAVFGDSWVEGALGVQELALWPNVLGRLLGVPAVARMGQGGSGYVAGVPEWNAKPYTDTTRLDRLVAYAPQLVIIQGSQNDDSATPAAITAAATAVYAAIANRLPDAQVVVVGPPRLNATPSAARLANRDAVKTAALAAPNVLGFVDQLGANPDVTGWITGTGTSAAVAGNGNADVVMGSDGAHMTAEGHAYFARRVFAAIVALLRGI